MTRAGEISVADLRGLGDAIKDQWLHAVDLWPYGYPRREYRAKKLARFGLIQSRKVGYMTEYFVPSKKE